VGGGARVTDDIPPIVYRANHHPLGHGGDGVEHAPVQADTNGLISHPMGRVVDTLAALRRRGTIDDEQLAAGRQFEEDFQASGLCELRAQDLSAPKGGMTDYHVVRVIASKHRIWKAIEALGGSTTPIALSAWHVLGMGRTLKDYASIEGFAPDRPLHPMTAQGLLIGALSVLAGHYSRNR
jgi:hypothetical protein